MDTSTNSTITSSAANISSSLALEDTEKWIVFVFAQLLGVPVSLLGIIGNILSMIIWTRKRMQWGRPTSSTSCYLVALSFSDLSYLIVINFGVLLPDRWQMISTEGQLIPLIPYSSATERIVMSMQPIINILANVSLYLVVAFTMERFVAITYPIRMRTLCTPKRARYVITAIVLAVIILLIPSFMENDPKMREREFHTSGWYRIGYNWGVMVFLFMVIPLFVLSVFNTLLIRKLLTAKRQRIRLFHNKNFSGPIRQEKSFGVLTQTIVLLVLIVFVCHAPAAIILCAFTYRQHTLRHDLSLMEISKWNMAFTVANFLSVLNSSINFLLYSVFSAKFRQICKQLILCNIMDTKETLSQPPTHDTEGGLIDNRGQPDTNESLLRG